MAGTKTLTEQVIALAKRPGGMETADVPGYSQRQASQSANRLAKEGRVHVSRVRASKLRYFGTADEAAAHTANVANDRASSIECAPHSWRQKSRNGKATAQQAECEIDMSRARITRYPLAPSVEQSMRPTARRMPADMPPKMRSGADEAMQHPSRCGNQLRYPDGRVEAVE